MENQIAEIKLDIFVELLLRDFIFFLKKFKGFGSSTEERMERAIDDYLQSKWGAEP